MRKGIPTHKVIRTRSIAFASNRSKALRNEAHATKPKCGRAVQSYDPEKYLNFWVNNLVSIRNENDNG
jgi:hypothetical protein